MRTPAAPVDAETATRSSLSLPRCTGTFSSHSDVTQQCASLERRLRSSSSTFIGAGPTVNWSERHQPPRQGPRGELPRNDARNHAGVNRRSPKQKPPVVVEPYDASQAELAAARKNRPARNQRGSESMLEISFPGSIGDPPVSSGDSPDGTGAAVRAEGDGFFANLRSAVPVGVSPTRAGQLLAQPIFQTRSKDACQLHPSGWR